MRTSIFILSLFILVILSCTPSKDPAPTSKNKITITSITPNVYWDEEITITGTGFDADMTKDSVDFGGVDVPDPGDPGYVNDTTEVFYLRYSLKISNTNYIIVSASPTKLVIKPLAPDSLYKFIFTSNYNNSSDNVNFRIRSKGASAVSKNVALKNIPIINSSILVNYPMVPGDSAALTISGVFGNSICDVDVYLSCSTLVGCTYVDAYLNSNLYYVPGPCTCDDFAVLVYGCGQGNNFSKGRLVKYDEINHRAYINFLVPENYFNTTYGSGYGPTINIKAQAVNKDGRSSKVVSLPIATYPTH